MKRSRAKAAATSSQKQARDEKERTPLPPTAPPPSQPRGPSGRVRQSAAQRSRPPRPAARTSAQRSLQAPGSKWRRRQESGGLRQTAHPKWQAPPCASQEDIAPPSRQGKQRPSPHARPPHDDPSSQPTPSHARPSKPGPAIPHRYGKEADAPLGVSAAQDSQEEMMCWAWEEGKEIRRDV